MIAKTIAQINEKIENFTLNAPTTKYNRAPIALVNTSITREEVVVCFVLDSNTFVKANCALKQHTARIIIKYSIPTPYKNAAPIIPALLPSVAHFTIVRATLTPP